MEYCSIIFVRVLGFFAHSVIWSVINFLSSRISFSFYSKFCTVQPLYVAFCGFAILGKGNGSIEIWYRPAENTTFGRRIHYCIFFKKISYIGIFRIINGFTIFLSLWKWKPVLSSYTLGYLVRIQIKIIIQGRGGQKQR